MKLDEAARIPDHYDDESLFAFLDDEMSGADRAAVEAHLARCPSCAARLKTVVALFEVLDDVPDVRLDLDMAPAVVAAVRAEAVRETVPEAARKSAQEVVRTGPEAVQKPVSEAARVDATHASPAQRGPASDEPSTIADVLPARLRWILVPQLIVALALLAIALPVVAGGTNPADTFAGWLAEAQHSLGAALGGWSEVGRRALGDLAMPADTSNTFQLMRRLDPVQVFGSSISSAQTMELAALASITFLILLVGNGALLAGTIHRRPNGDTHA